MSILHESWPEPHKEDVAKRLRMFMGDKKLSRSKLALASGISRTSLGTKLDGDVDFTVTEVNAIARALGKSWLWVMTGEDIGGQGPDGGGSTEPAPTADKSSCCDSRDIHLVTECPGSPPRRDVVTPIRPPRRHVPVAKPDAA